MSSAERVARHQKRQTDRAISSAYARLSQHPLACETFAEMLRCTRTRAPQLLAAPAVDDHHPGIEALVNLARFRHAHIRRLSAWGGCDGSWRRAVASLAQHLAGAYPVPRFLASSWYAGGAFGERKREWFVAHGAGSPFRSLDLPLPLTRKMEHLFLGSPDHLGIECALRRAELLGMGAPDSIVRAVLATRLAADLSNGEFWRTVWAFLIANAGTIDPGQVGPIIDFIQSVRHERVVVETMAGIVLQEPPQPWFSMKGRTLQSVLRLMNDWHRRLGLANGGLTWEPSRLRPLAIEEPSQNPAAPPSIWFLVELTSGAQLRTEGAALHHCVASYADRCWRGASRIWSLRVRRGDKVRHLLTIEVDMKKRAVVQARGWGNGTPTGKSRRLLQDWALRERLRLRI